MVRTLVRRVRALLTRRRRPPRLDPFVALVAANWTWEERRVLFAAARAGMLLHSSKTGR